MTMREYESMNDAERHAWHKAWRAYRSRNACAPTRTPPQPQKGTVTMNIDHEIRDLQRIEKKLIAQLRAEGVKDPLATALKLHGKNAKRDTARDTAREAELAEMDRKMGIRAELPAVRRADNSLLFDALGVNDNRNRRS